MDFDFRVKTVDLVSDGFEHDTPEQQVYWHNSFALGDRVELDLILRYVDRVASWPVRAYTTMDARLAWQVTDDLEVALAGQNLFDAEHLEASPSILDTHPTQVERGVYASMNWSF